MTRSADVSRKRISPARAGLWGLAVLLGSSAGNLPGDSAVNTHTDGDQNRPAVAIDGQGRFIVVWTSEGQDGDGRGVFGRRFDADGQPLGDEFAVNLNVTGDQTQPRVSADSAGNFLVVWQGPDATPGVDVLGRRFDASGTPLGGEIRLNESTALDQRSPAAALAEDGSFLAVWANDERLVARHFDEFGMATTGDFELAVDDGYGPYGFRSFHRQDVESLPGGNFVVVWQDHFYAGYGYSYTDSIRGAILDDEAQLLTTWNVASGAPSEQDRSPALAPGPEGGFVVVWGGYTDYAAYSRLLGRRFDASGAPLGGIFDPTPQGVSFLRPEGVAAAGSGRFLVVWNDPEIEGRYVAADGTPLAEPFVINTVQSGSDREPAVAGAGGEVVVAWTQDTGTPAMDEVVATASFLPFLDGFESGDTSSWSAAAP